MSVDKRAQVAAQCRAVAHLAGALREAYSEYAWMFLHAGDVPNNMVEPVGERTARLMEMLGDILDGMGTVEEKDAWLNPIFEEARRLWPTPVRSVPDASEGEQDEP